VLRGRSATIRLLRSSTGVVWLLGPLFVVGMFTSRLMSKKATGVRAVSMVGASVPAVVGAEAGTGGNVSIVCWKLSVWVWEAYA
jgi:hypothetical protein